MNKRLLTASLLLAVSCGPSALGDSGAQYRKSAIMNANQVRTVFGNWGVIAQPADQGHRGAWRNDNDGYVGDVSIFVGAEITSKNVVTSGNVTFHSVATCPVARPTQQPDQDKNTGKYWTFEPVGGYFNANQDKVAISTDKTTWPESWPDKTGDLTDPGWRGEWNGYFGKRASADEEAYFVMDDNDDERFNSAANNSINVAFHPDSLNTSRNGMGLVVTVRALQWAQFLAQDNIFWLYEITNTGTTTYNKTVFGMLVGTYVGVTSTEDNQEWNDDWSFYSPSNNITYTGDFKAINGQSMKNPLWVGGTGLVGYAFLESPGNPFDGIDNDGDADSSAFGTAAPKFVSADFDSVLLTAGKRVVLVNDDFTRTVYTIQPSDTVLHTRGLTLKIKPGVTKVVEGNILTDFQGNQSVNTNAYDGVDNNFNGLIDENFRIHYRQVKVSPGGKVLLDILRPLRHADYLSGAGTGPYSMIDEKRDDLIDNNLNWDPRYDDVGRDGIAGTHDFGEGDGIPTSGFDANYHDTGLPGEPHIDKTDVNESDQIGLTNFSYFQPSNQINLGDDEDLWKRLVPGFFDVPASIVNNRPINGEDGDFIYGSGYFPLLAKTTERFSLALVYGGGIPGDQGLDADLADLLKNKKTVQKIYDANYQFPTPPDKPTLTAVPGDHQVTLYWDRKSEASIDPVLRIKNFEGYKLYKSTDPNFSDIYTITDGSGAPKGYRPAAQWDLVDGIKGYFQALGDQYQGAYGYTYYLGGDTGLVHTYVDNNVDNGRRYFYALVAYSKGDAVAGIFPAENTKFVTILPTGSIIHDQNVQVVVPNSKTAGYIPPASGVPLTHTVKYGAGTIGYQTADPTALTTHKYRVEFFDTEADSLDPSGNPVISLDSTKWERVTTAYSVHDLTTFTEQFTSLDTIVVPFNHRNIVPSTVVVRDHNGAVVPASTYILNAPLGTLRGRTGGSFPKALYTITYQYDPVAHSPNIKGSPFATETRDADFFDGMQLSFQNYWQSRVIDSLSGWAGTSAYVWSFSPAALPVLGITGYRKPANYEYRFSSTFIDTSTAFDNPDFPVPATPVKFRIFNRTDSTYVKFYYFDLNTAAPANGNIKNNVQVVLLEKNPRGVYSPTWTSYFTTKQGVWVDTLYNLTSSDRLVINTSQPFRNGDIFEFTPVPATTDMKTAQSQLPKVRVVPNPYVTASAFELPLPPAITSGRGERKIDFIHLPPNATVKIFTSRGDYVQTLRHDGNIEDGTVSWNLKTHENLDVAYGIYFYVVESPVGNTTGKIAIIK